MSDPPDSSRAEAKRWLRQAEEDLRTAELVAQREDLPPRVACFLSHLAAEKAIKAWLVSLGIPFPKIHDLVELQRMLPPKERNALRDEDLDLLNPWAIGGRYPGDVVDAPRALSLELVRAAGRVLDAATSAVAG